MAGDSGKPRPQSLAAWRPVAAPLAGDRSLRGLAALKRLKPEQREALERRLQVREYRRGELVYQPGEEAHSLYVVLAGVVRSEERRVGKECRWRGGRGGVSRQGTV